ncbi:hypothetical protein PQX77_011234 [Marasmius sp. AFHP31]|nr:hypothetical protein PQX77_011234 [Marasmius sp. AFHP31]
MPARRKHKTKEAQRQASQHKSKTYYQRNREEILAKKRATYGKAAARDRKLRKQEVDEEKRALWETKSQTEVKTDPLKRLRALEENINCELSNSGSGYLERLFAEFLAWTQISPEAEISPISPLELPFKVFSSMLDTVAKIGNAILNEYGPYAEWKECQRLTRRIRCLIRCANEWECMHLEHQMQADAEGKSVLEDLYLNGKLEFQGVLARQWLDRASVRRYIATLDKTDD